MTWTVPHYRWTSSQYMFLWKISQGLVQGYSVEFVLSSRRGRLAVIPPYSRKVQAKVRNARESSLAIKGAKIFNLLPAYIRDIDGSDQTYFKSSLDVYLSSIPDQPTIPGRSRAATTNSLMDQIPIYNGDQ